jgi:DNA-binding MarR family transcriptional regulator
MASRRFVSLYNQPGHIIRRAQQFAAAPGEEANPTPLTTPQYSVLHAIALRPGMEQQEVAAAVFYDPVTTGAILKKLHELGAIHRDASDRSVRGRAISIASEGQAMLDRIAPYLARVQALLLQRLDAKEQEVLMHLLSKLAGVRNRFNPAPTAHGDAAEPSAFAPLYDQPGHVLRRARQFAASVFETEVGFLGVTEPQFAALYAISLAPGMEQQEIARSIFYDAATTSGILARLLKLGAIRRTASGRSTRGVAVDLAPDGEALLQRLLPAIWQHHVRILERLAVDERPVVLELLSRAAGVENTFNPTVDGRG